MPKQIDKQTRVDIVEFVKKTNNQHEAARHFKLSRTFIHALVHNKPTVKNRTRWYCGSTCPITGFKN